MNTNQTNNAQTILRATRRKSAAHLALAPLTLALGLLIAFALGTMTAITFAGNLTPPGAPSDTMYTLTDLYNLASGTPTAWVPGRTITTGQTVCYDAAGSSISCTGTGQDGEIQAGLAFDYTDNGDGTVTDNNTGLTWQQGYSTSTMTWSAAATSCANNDANLPGTGWRLPNIKELFTLVDFTVSGVAKIDLTAFPGTPVSDFWSATTYPNSGYQYFAMHVNFNVGYVYLDTKTNICYVRCVQE
jgi:hypothetical protein